MSRTVDEKVVEMKFNNQNFEKNVSQSMNTISKLKSNLDFKGVESKAASSMSKIASSVNNIDINGLSKAVDTINYRFSTMGIIATNIINQITNSITGKLTGAFNMVIGQIKSGGLSRAMNLEKANFQMANLLKDEKEVEAVMKNVSDAVDGTAYGLDAAAVVASQLTASGSKAGDELYNQLRSIAGVAAMTSSSYQEIGDIYTTIAGQGKLMGMQLTQLASRGLNVAAIMSKQMNITEAEFRDKVSKGQITFQQFANAMVEEFGEAAGKANETFDGALSNAKSALSRIGAKVYTPALTEARDILNELRLGINALSKAIDPAINIINFAMVTLSKKVQGIIKGITEDLKNMSEDSALVKFINTATNSLGDFLNALVGEKSIFDYLVDTLFTVGNIFVTLFETFERGRSYFIKTENSIRPVTDILRLLSEILKDVSNWLLNMEWNGHRVSRTFSGIISIFKIFGSVIVSIISGLKTVLQEAGLLGGEILSITAEIGFRLQMLYEKMRYAKVFDSIANTVTSIGRIIISTFKTAIEWIDKMEKDGQKISRTFSSITSVFKILGGFIKAVFSGIKQAMQEAGVLPESLGKLGETILQITSKIGDKLSGLYEKLNNLKFFESISNIIGSVGRLVITIFDTIIRLVGRVISGGSNIFSGFIEGTSKIFSVFFDASTSGIVGLVDKITYVLNRFREEISKEDGVFAKVEGHLKSFFHNLNEGAKKVANVISKAVEFIKNTLKSVLDSDFIGSISSGILRGGSVVGLITPVIVKIAGAISKIKNVFSFGKTVTDFVENMSNALKAIPEIGENFSNVLEKLGGVLQSYQNNLKANLLKEIATAVLMLAGSLYIVSTIPLGDLAKAAVAIGAIGAALLGATKWLLKMGEIKSKPIDWKKDGFLNGLKQTILEFKDVGKYAAKMAVIGTMIVKLAAAVFIVALAIKQIADIVDKNPGTAIISVLIVIGSMYALIGAILLLDKVGTKNISRIKAIGGLMLAISASVLLMAIGYKLIGSTIEGLDSDKIFYTTLIFFGSIAAMVLAILVLDAVCEATGADKMAAVAAVVLAMGVCVVMMGVALAMIATVVKTAGWQDTLIAAGLMVGMLFVLIALIIALGAASVAFSPAAMLAVIGVLLAAAVVLIALGVAITMFSMALGVIITEIGVLTALLSSENCGAAWAALGYLAVMLITLAVGLAALTFGIIGVGVLILLGEALKTLIPMLILLSALPSEDIWSGIGKIAQALLGFILVGLMATLLSPVLFVLAGVLTALGVALTMCSVSLYMFISVFTSLTALTQVSSELIVNGMSRIADGIHALVMNILDHADEFIDKLTKTIVGSAPKIKEMIKAIIDIAASAINEHLPIIVETVKNAINIIAEKLHIEGVVQFIGSIARVLNTFFGYLAGMVDQITAAGENTTGSYIDGIKNMIDQLTETAIQILVAFLNSLASAIERHNQEIHDAGKRVADAFIGAVNDKQKDSEDSGSNIINGLIRGLQNNTGGSMIWQVGRAIGQLAISAINAGAGNASPSKKTYKSGVYIIQGLIRGLRKNKSLIATSKDVGAMVTDRIQEALMTLQDYANEDYSIEPVITPVLDMSGVTASADAINNMLSGNSSFGLAASINAQLDKNQNENPYGDITKAIGTLHNDLQGLEANNYTVNGLTYDDGSSVAGAVTELIRATKVGRRM